MVRRSIRRVFLAAVIALVAFSLGNASSADAAGEENGVLQRIVKLEEQVANLVAGLAAEVSALNARVTPLESARVRVVTASADASGGRPATTRVETYIEMEPIYAPIGDGSQGYQIVGYREVTRYRTVTEPAVPAIATANAQCPSGTVAMSGQGAASQPSGAATLDHSRFADATGAAPTTLAGHTGWSAKATFAVEGSVVARAFCVSAP